LGDFPKSSKFGLKRLFHAAIAASGGAGIHPKMGGGGLAILLPPQSRQRRQQKNPSDKKSAHLDLYSHLNESLPARQPARWLIAELFCSAAELMVFVMTQVSETSNVFVRTLCLKLLNMRVYW
jgi:hypothetical protein